jgi:hypothetical protein
VIDLEAAQTAVTLPKIGTRRGTNVINLADAMDIEEPPEAETEHECSKDVQDEVPDVAEIILPCPPTRLQNCQGSVTFSHSDIEAVETPGRFVSSKVVEYMLWEWSSAPVPNKKLQDIRMLLASSDVCDFILQAGVEEASRDHRSPTTGKILPLLGSKSPLSDMQADTEVAFYRGMTQFMHIKPRTYWHDDSMHPILRYRMTDEEKTRHDSAGAAGCVVHWSDCDYICCVPGRLSHFRSFTVCHPASIGIAAALCGMKFKRTPRSMKGKTLCKSLTLLCTYCGHSSVLCSTRTRTAIM